MATDTAKGPAGNYVLGRLVLDYIRAFMWPLVAVVIVLVYQNDVRTLIFEREIDVFGVRIGAKVEQIESQTQAEIADIRLLLEAQRASDSNGSNPEIAEDIEAKLSTLERNITREVSEIQTQQAQRIAPARQQTALPPARQESRATLAAAAERRGFEALIDHDIERAIQAFDEARSIWPEYHNVAEIGRALRKREDKLRDPDGPGWQQLYREIITRYSWGLPEDLRKAIRQGATQAY